MSLLTGGVSRDRIVRLLRQGPSTVEDLADAIQISPGAVRQHLAVLERDGFVVRSGQRRRPQAGKPAIYYEIAPDVERSFSSAYQPVLSALLLELPSHLARSAVQQVLRDVGDRLAAAVPVARGDFGARVRAGAKILEGLGGATEVVTEGDGTTMVIRGFSCPLADAVGVCPDVCSVVESMLSVAIDSDVRERCDRSERPRCRFEVRPPDAA